MWKQLHPAALLRVAKSAKELQAASHAVMRWVASADATSAFEAITLARIDQNDVFQMVHEAAKQRLMGAEKQNVALGGGKFQEAVQAAVEVATSGMEAISRNKLEATEAVLRKEFETSEAALRKEFEMSGVALRKEFETSEAARRKEFETAETVLKAQLVEEEQKHLEVYRNQKGKVEGLRKRVIESVLAAIKDDSSDSGDDALASAGA